MLAYCCHMEQQIFFIFELGSIPLSILEAFEKDLAIGRSFQVRELWLIDFTTNLWFVWHARNKSRFDEKNFSVAEIGRLISSQIRAASGLARGSMLNTINDLRILRCNVDNIMLQ
ncbi:hypothetical protein RchiOBHm_Chr2g0092021 [Rosa chinensis]|uniref:Uncharacterized protein n=1 Tax=Rosa chinensis TaxID=74649 RepID=A0A2P6RJW2_ROSCH|nr:hypothetical protein RchiOBHm_Chr2g0092021 [Rosa chinensis]